MAATEERNGHAEIQGATAVPVPAGLRRLDIVVRPDERSHHRPVRSYRVDGERWCPG